MIDLRLDRGKCKSSKLNSHFLLIFLLTEDPLFLDHFLIKNARQREYTSIYIIFLELLFNLLARPEERLQDHLQRSSSTVLSILKRLSSN